MRWIHTFGTLMTLALAVAATAQETTPPAAPEEEEEKAVAPKWNIVTVGIYNRDVSGNAHKARQYATSPNGLVLNELRLLHPGDGFWPWANLNIRGYSDDDRAMSFRTIFDGGRGSASYSDNRFNYADVTPVINPDSIDKNREASFSYAIAPNLGAYWKFSEQKKDQRFEPPKDSRVMRMKSYAGGIGGTVGNGYFGLNLVDSRYYDRTGASADVFMRRFDFNYGTSLTSNFDVEGVWSKGEVRRRGTEASKADAMALYADWYFGDTTSLYFNAKKETYTNPYTETAYLRKRLTGSAKLVHRYNDGVFQFGFTRKEAERMRGDESYVDVPTWSTYDAKLTRRLDDNTRMTMKGSWEHMNRGAAMVTMDARSLYWDDRIRAQGRLERSGDRFNGYVDYLFKFDENDNRGVEVNAHFWTMGGSYQLNDASSMWFELADESFQTHGLWDEGGYNLDDFFPSARTVALGFDSAISPKSSVSAALTLFTSRNANPLALASGNARGTDFTATYRQQISEDSSFEVVIAPWRYRDRLVEQMGYRSTVIGVSFSTKF